MTTEDKEKTVRRFIQTSGIDAYNIMRIAKEYCKCSSCCWFVQHYNEKGKAIEFGHCTRNSHNTAKKPNNTACGYWDVKEENPE